MQGVLVCELEEETACPFPAVVLGDCLTPEMRKTKGTSSQLVGDFHSAGYISTREMEHPS